MTTIDVILACARDSEFVKAWSELRGVKLPATPLEKLIDEASGHGAGIAKLFIEDVIDTVVNRLPNENKES